MTNADIAIAKISKDIFVSLLEKGLLKGSDKQKEAIYQGIREEFPKVIKAVSDAVILSGRG